MTKLLGLPWRYLARLSGGLALLAVLQPLHLKAEAAEPQTLADAIIQARDRSTTPTKESASFKEPASPRKPAAPSKLVRQAKHKSSKKQAVASPEETVPTNGPATLADAIIRARGETRSTSGPIGPTTTAPVASTKETDAQALTPSGPALELLAETDEIGALPETINPVADNVSEEEPAQLFAGSTEDRPEDNVADSLAESLTDSVEECAADEAFDYTSLVMPIQCAEPEEIRGLLVASVPAASGPDSLLDDVKPLSAGRTNFETPSGTTPVDLAAERFGQQPVVVGDSPEDRRPLGMVYYWQSSSMFHRALYFEDVNLERYGYTYGLWQPAVSAIHFFGTIPALPYLVTVHPQRECIYTLGYYRPGDCVPYQKSWPPLSLHAATVEAAAVSAFFLWIP